MNTDAAKTVLERRIKLLKWAKRGKRTGNMQWVRLLVLLICIGIIATVQINAFVLFREKENFKFLTVEVCMIFVLALNIIGYCISEMNERFDALFELIGEDNVVRRGEASWD